VVPAVGYRQLRIALEAVDLRLEIEMAARIGAVAALLAFSVCVISGGVYGDNPLATTLSRALLAMGVTFVIGLVVGWMAQRMLEENVKTDRKTEIPQVESGEEDR
jgi:type VI protein secretion system component VasK